MHFVADKHSRAGIISRFKSTNVHIVTPLQRVTTKYRAYY